MKHLMTFCLIVTYFLVYPQSKRLCVTLDTALIKVGYDRAVMLDTLNPSNVKKDYLTLQAGRKASVFYSEQRRLEDSLMSANGDYTLEIFRNRANLNRLANLEKEVVVRNRELQQTMSHLRFDMSNWVLYEELEEPKWTITEESDMVLDIPCIKATTNFRGREWIAFFAPDIPLSEGPWKLCGLPGLILKAFDSKNHYVYEAKELSTKAPGLVQYIDDVDRGVLKDRIKALCLRKEAKSLNIREIMRAAYNLKINPRPQTQEEEARKNHDFEETDYPHN